MKFEVYNKGHELFNENLIFCRPFSSLYITGLWYKNTIFFFG